MAPFAGLSVFRKKGSLGEDDIKTTGFEIFHVLKYHQNKFLLIISFLFSIAGGVMPILMVNTMGGMVSSLSKPGSVIDNVTDLILQMVVIQVIMLCVMVLSNLFRVMTNAPFVISLRSALYKAYMNLDMEYFDETSTGIMVSRMSEDVLTLRETYVDKAAQVLQGLAQALAGVIYSVIRSWLVSMVAIGCIPLIILVFFLSEKFIEKLWEEYSKAATSNTNRAEEVISQFRIVKSFDCELKEYEDYAGGLDGVHKIFKKTSLAHGMKNGILYLLTNGMTGGLVYLACYIVVEKPQYKLQIDLLIQVFMGAFFIVMGLTNATSYVDDFRKANVSAVEVLNVLNKKPKVDRFDGRDMKRVIGSIEFKNVSFKYSSRSEYAVKDLSFKVNAGETVAFVGESGCGKTTTLQLLQRFYEIDEGEILLDDLDIRELSPYNLRSYISAVPQTPVLYSMSVKDNIAYAKRTIEDQKVYEAAQIGNCHDFISALPENYKTIVQQTSLSGGQKQRICISRAILANTPILLLDEATAALDTESEQLVQQSLEKFRHGKTALVVAHRLATVMHADRIFVFANGAIVESGTHQTLLAKNGVYADLVNFQLQ